MEERMRTSNPAIEFDEPWDPPKRRNKHHDHVVTQLRAEEGLSQEGLAEVWGVSRGLIALVEAGERSLPFTLEEGRQKLAEVAAQRAKLRSQVGCILGTLP